MLHHAQVDPALHQCVSNGARGKELRVKFGKEGEQNEGRKGARKEEKMAGLKYNVCLAGQTDRFCNIKFLKDKVQALTSSTLSITACTNVVMTTSGWSKISTI